MSRRPTHLLDGRERVRVVREASDLLDQSGLPTGYPYPQMDRARAARHGLFLVHTCPADEWDGSFYGELLVTGDRLEPLDVEGEGG